MSMSILFRDAKTLFLKRMFNGAKENFAPIALRKSVQPMNLELWRMKLHNPYLEGYLGVRGQRYL